MIDPADGVSLETVASGNGIAAGVQGQDLDFASRQTVDSDVTASSDAEIHGWTPNTVAASAATGNQGEAWATDGGTIDAYVRQVVGDRGDVTAHTNVRAELSSSGDTQADSAAIGNSQSYAVGTGAYARSDTAQRQHGSIKARTDASLFHVKGQATLTATAASNDVKHTGNGASGEAKAKQDATGDTIATIVASVRSGALVDATAQASGNTVSAHSLSREVEVKTDQENEGYVRAESYIYVQDFGGVTSTASGVGNSLWVDQAGDVAEIHALQENHADVDAEAAFYGGAGYDVNVSATAYGNTIYGSVCSDCDGRLQADNRQINTAGVSASAKTAIGGSARTVNSSAHAVGNNAAYYANRPGN